MKRLLIYFIYDEYGIIDDYIVYLLEKILPFTEEITVVSNGPLEDRSKEKISGLCTHIIERKNEGFDVWAYKEAIEYYGWENLTGFDEIILMNFTIAGPLYDLKEMFSVIEKKEVDFWGITKCFQVDDPKTAEIWKNPLGYMPEHIQSSFMAFRRSLVSSEAFQQFWNNMPMINSYFEAGGRYEQIFTKHFSDLGFRWECYTDYSSINVEYYGAYPLLTEALLVVKDLRSPFFKRKTFYTERAQCPLRVPYAVHLKQFIENETEYDMKMFMKNLIRKCNQRDLMDSLMLINVI